VTHAYKSWMAHFAALLRRDKHICHFYGMIGAGYWCFVRGVWLKIASYVLFGVLHCFLDFTGVMSD